MRVRPATNCEIWKLYSYQQILSHSTNNTYRKYQFAPDMSGDHPQRRHVRFEDGVFDAVVFSQQSTFAAETVAKD